MFGFGNHFPLSLPFLIVIVLPCWAVSLIRRFFCTLGAQRRENAGQRVELGCCVAVLEERLSLKLAFPFFVSRFWGWISRFQCFKCVALCRVTRWAYANLDNRFTLGACSR